MVWGVEKTVPLPDGSTKPGAEAGRETRAYFERLLAEGGPAAIADPPSVADIRYRVMNTCPRTGFRSSRRTSPESDRSIRLQRAAMPRVIEGDPPIPSASAR